ncbi:MAG: DUF3999 family protein [Thermodesulfobacteriota bacterium]
MGDRSLGTIIIGLAAVLVLWAGAAPCARFDPKGWGYFRVVESPEGSAEGNVAIPLDARIIAKCRGDLADLRIVSSEGLEVPHAIGTVGETEAPRAFSAKVFRIARPGDKWTDVWIDKGAKTVTREITIETASKDFVRRVELRGSDNGRDGYVIRMNGLIVDAKGPPPIRSLTVGHPLNAHQYLHIRILDGDEPPLKIAGVQCRAPEPEKAHRPLMDLRTLENRLDPVSKSALVVAEMTPDLFPVNRIALQTTAKEFVRRAVISGTNDLAGETWAKVSEEALFRVAKDRCSTEKLDASFPEKAFRYWKVELSSGTHGPVTVDGILAAPSVRVLYFRRIPGNAYRLYYGKSKAVPIPEWEGGRDVDTGALLKSASVRLGEETRHITKVEADPEPISQPRPEPALLGYTYPVGIGVVLLGLILLLVKIVGVAASRRRNDPMRGTRLVRNRRPFR